MKLLFIRHTSVDVPPGTCYGQSDVPLADTFEQEAADVLLRLQPHQPLLRAYTSPLSRARRLAAFCGYPDAQADDRLMEMNMGNWEMQRYDDISDPAIEEWYEDFLHRPASGGESFPQLRERIASFIDDVRQELATHQEWSERSVAVFTHGGVLVAAALYACLYPEAEAFSHQPPYGGILEIDIQPLNDQAHDNGKDKRENHTGR